MSGTRDMRRQLWRGGLKQLFGVVELLKKGYLRVLPELLQVVIVYDGHKILHKLAHVGV